MPQRNVWLWVEGDLFREALKMYLQRWGFHVEQAQCGQGLGAKVPALIVMDYPARFSPSASLLTGEHPVPVLFLVANGQAVRQLAAELPIVFRYGCLPKPCTIRDLQDAVQSLTGVSLLQKVAPEQVIPPVAFPLPGIIGPQIH